MREALQVESDSEMNSLTAITYPGLSPSVISDPACTNDKVRNRTSFSPSRVTRRQTSKRSPSLKSGVAPTRTDALQQNILQELFLTSRKRFVRIAYRILENNEDAEDAVQDAFVSSCRHFAKFEGRCCSYNLAESYRHECCPDVAAQTEEYALLFPRNGLGDVVVR